MFVVNSFLSKNNHRIPSVVFRCGSRKKKCSQGYLVCVHIRYQEQNVFIVFVPKPSAASDLLKESLTEQQESIRLTSVHFHEFMMFF